MRFWYEWIADNPFLQRDMRRWCRRGQLWRLSLWASLMPALAVAGVLLLCTYLPPRVVAALPVQPGLVILSVVTFVHLFVLATAWQRAPFLYEDTVAGRLDFILLLPLERRKLLAKLGIARACLLMPLLLIIAPFLLLALPYGGVDLRDAAASIAVLGLLLVGVPSSQEVALARRGPPPASATTPTRKGRQYVNPALALGPVAFQMCFMLRAIPFGSVPGLAPLLVRVGPLVPPDIAFLFPFSLVPALAHLLWVPRDFLLWKLPPLIPLGVWWAVARRRRLWGAAEMWAREASSETLPDGKPIVRLRASSGRPEELRVEQCLGILAAVLLFITLAGLIWRPLVLSGDLGRLVGSATPAGSVAALLVLLGGHQLLVSCERLRWEWAARGKTPATSWRAGVRDCALRLGIAVAVVFGVSLAGGVVPWPEPVTALARLALVAGAILLFAAGCRAHLVGDPEALPPRAQSFAGLAHLVAYGLPLLPLLWRPGDPAVHQAAAFSPIYGLLSLLPGVWPVAPEVPLAAAALMAAGVGALLLHLTPAAGRQEQKRAARKTRARLDPVEERVARWVAGWDNPLVTLAFRQVTRAPMGLGYRMMAQPAAVGMSTVLIGVGILSVAVWQSGRLPLQILAGPVGLGLCVGSIACLVFAGILFFFAGLAFCAPVAAAANADYLSAKLQQRLPFLLVSPLTDRQIVLGTLGGPALRACADAGGIAVVGLGWLLLALVFGAGPGWAVGLLCLLALLIATGMHGALLNFQLWRGRWWIRVLAGIVLGASVVGWILLTEGVMIGMAVGARWVDAHAALILVVMVALVLLGAALLPLSCRLAAGAVRACRTSGDIEPTATR